MTTDPKKLLDSLSLWVGKPIEPGKLAHLSQGMYAHHHYMYIYCWFLVNLRVAVVLHGLAPGPGPHVEAEDGLVWALGASVSVGQVVTEDAGPALPPP